MMTTVESSPDRRANQAVKGVSFKPTINVREIPYPSPEDFSRIWYAKLDFDRFHARDIRILELLQRHETRKLVVKNGDCARGVERLNPEAREQLAVRQMMANAAVFEMQRDQISNGIYDPEGIAKAYRRACQSSLRDASQKALRDEKFVEEHVKASVKAQLLTKEAFPNLKLSQRDLSPAKNLSPTRKGKRARKLIRATGRAHPLSL